MCFFEALISLLASSPKDASLLSHAAYLWLGAAFACSEETICEI
jgi:hypothetical protein